MGLNHAVARLPLFEKPEDFEAFERVLREAWERVSLPIFFYCIMPNHWHFVVCPEMKSQLTDFLRWLTHTHTMRWHAHHHTEGTGHLYQGLGYVSRCGKRQQAWHALKCEGRVVSKGDSHVRK